MSTSGRVERTPRFNALSHGLNSGYVLLPGDNVAAFCTLRRRLFDHYQPRTIEDAQCVERIASGHWRQDRAALEHVGFKQHLGAVMDGQPAFAGPACDPDPHRLHHRATDCAKEVSRWERSVRFARAELRLMQRQRVQNFSLGQSTPLEDYRVFLAEGAPVLESTPEVGSNPDGESRRGAESQPGAATVLEPALERTQKTLTTGSTERQTRKNRERRAATEQRRLPRHWSHRQRQAARLRAARGAAPQATAAAG